MTNFNLERTRNLLQAFRFTDLFIEELGWNEVAQQPPQTCVVDEVTYQSQPIAELGGVVVFELVASEDGSQEGTIPDAKGRQAVHSQISQQYHENLLIFVDAADESKRGRSVWIYIPHRRGGEPSYPRTHTYVKGQTGDLFLSKLKALYVDLIDLDEAGNLSVLEATGRLKAALDIEQVTKKFFDQFKLAHTRFLGYISGIDDERERRWYTSVMLNRLMFIWFLQMKSFLNGGDTAYLQGKLAACKTSQGADQYFRHFLQPLFFDGFATPEDQRDSNTRRLLGEVKYLNGGLFLRHPIEERWPEIAIPDVAFKDLFDLFSRYSWNLDDSPGGQDDEINPDVLGYIFEKYINQKEFGAYYTRPEITEYICEQTIHQLILDKLAELNRPVPGLPAPPQYEGIGDLLLNLDALRCQQLLHQVLPKLSLLDPACGSGAFLVAALKTLTTIYQGVLGRIEFLPDSNNNLSQWLAEVKQKHPSLNYFIKKRIITDNLYGVDIMAEAVEIARLRLFLALIASARKVADLEPLPNIDFNILAGNALIGLLRVDETQYQLGLGQESYTSLVARKNTLVAQYRKAAYDTNLRTLTDTVRTLRDEIEKHRHSTNQTLNDILLSQFKELKIKFEQATWDSQKNKPGKAKKRDLQGADIEGLQPFHWGYEFDEVMNGRGGFDAIMTNPPWEVIKPQAKEFFVEHSELITKNKMRIEDFKKQQKSLLAKPAIRQAWLAYLSRFPHQSRYFRQSPAFNHQRAVVNERTTGSDLNLYKLFTEQCHNLLREGGHCGLVVPSGIYTDLGATGLRKMLFSESKIKALFGFENRRHIFEGVDSRFKFVVLNFTKGGFTATFPAAFMRHDVSELAAFSKDSALNFEVELIKRYSPGSLSVMEFGGEIDMQIAEKMSAFPLLGERIADAWNLSLTNEFHMTGNSDLFSVNSNSNCLPLYEGKMIHQFDHRFAQARYWVDEEKGRQVLLKREKDIKQKLDYQFYRLGYRSVAASTNERTMIATILPPNVFFSHSINATQHLSPYNLLFITAMFNSLIIDYMLRQRVSQNLTMFYIYQLPVPRLTQAEPAFAPIVERAAKLICTTPQFDELAAAVGLGSHAQGVRDEGQRAALRAELDGLIAHLYGLTADEFRHILSTFPLVAEEVKAAARQAYQHFAPDPEIRPRLISTQIDFRT